MPRPKKILDIENEIITEEAAPEAAPVVLEDEIVRLLMGGSEMDGYTLIPNDVVADNHLVESTGVSKDGFTLCKMKA